MSAKNQHYVPQFILRGFATPGTRKRAIAAFNLPTGVHIRGAAIKGHASSLYLYGKDGRAEATFADLEDKASSALATLVATGRPPNIGSEEHQAITMFSALQYGRTPAAAAELDASATGLTRGIVRSSPSIPASVRERAPNLQVTHERAELFEGMLAIQLSPVLMDLAIAVVINDSSLEFICPDTGIAFHNQWAKPVRGQGVLGYACSGLQIFQPISSRALLCRYDGLVYESRRNARTIHLSKKEDVARVNRLLCSTAEHLVYYSGDPNTSNELVQCRMSLRRATRAALVTTERFTSETGTHQLVGYHLQQTTEPFQTSWLQIKRSMREVPIVERGRSFRPMAQKVADNLRTPPTLPSDIEGMVFRKLSD